MQRWSASLGVGGGVLDWVGDGDDGGDVTVHADKEGGGALAAQRIR